MFFFFKKLRNKRFYLKQGEENSKGETYASQNHIKQQQCAVWKRLLQPAVFTLTRNGDVTQWSLRQKTLSNMKKKYEFLEQGSANLKVVCCLWYTIFFIE